MKRLAMLLPVPVVVLLAAGFLNAKLDKGDRTTLLKHLGSFMNPELSADDQEKAQREFIDWFGKKNNAGVLAEVADLSDVLADSAIRPSQRAGVTPAKVLVPFEGAKITCAVSVPKKYSGSAAADPWPLIICLPDRGQKPEAYLDACWPGDAIRETCVIAVVGIDYSEKEVKSRKPVTDENGKIKYQEVKEKVPFSVDVDPAFTQFWGAMKALMLFEFKIDPNRVILDGVGFGATCALEFATRGAWRFAGIVLRGGTLAGDDIVNLAHMKALSRPAAIADEAAKKSAEATVTALAGLLKEKLTDGAAMDDAAVATWVTGLTRDRYPLPHKWNLVVPGAQQWSYWFGITGVQDPAAPSSVTLTSDKAKKRIDIESTNVTELTLFVNDMLVDMASPFDLYVNGEQVRKAATFTRSADQLLKHAFLEPPVDPGAVFTSELSGIAIKVQKPKAPEPPKDAGGEKKPPEAPKDGGEKKPEPPKDDGGSKPPEQPKDGGAEKPPEPPKDGGEPKPPEQPKEGDETKPPEPPKDGGAENQPK